LNVVEQPRVTEPIRAAAEWTGVAPVLPRWNRAGTAEQTAGRRSAASLLVPAAGFLALAALIALGVHTPSSLLEGPAILAMVWMVPFAAAGLCVLAFYRPWPAYLAILVLTPVWDAAQVSWQAGSVQVILQTVFMAALAAALLRRSLTRATWIEFPEAAAIRSVASERLVAVSLIALLGLAVASTAISRDVANSTTSLLHGIIEPVAMGVFLVALRPTRRQLAWLVVVLGISAGIGSFINLFQYVPTLASPRAFQGSRMDLAVLTYNNVGLFGQVLAMAVPLLFGAILARRHLELRRSVQALLVVALLLCLVGLFLTLSKSAWLATGCALVVLAFFVVRSWRKRISILAAAVLLSAAVVPWPAFFLQVSPPLNNAYRTAMVSVIGQSRFDSWNPATVSGQGSLGFRFRAAESGINIAEAYPVLGVGLNNFHWFYMHGYAVYPRTPRVDHAHSIWPELAAEMGIPATTIIAFIYLMAMFALWRVHRRAPDAATRLLASALLAALVAWLIVSTAFGSDIYRSWRNMSSELVMMAVITAAAFALARATRAARAQAEPAVRRRIRPGS
jgi:O-antigen ligase